MPNHGGKGARRRYQERRRRLKQSKPTSFTRTEGDIRYEYNHRIANLFAGWSTQQRDKGITPVFGDFYNQLQQEDRDHVTIGTSLKNSNNETSKTETTK
jgi:hypothetical protein